MDAQDENILRDAVHAALDKYRQVGGKCSFVRIRLDIAKMPGYQTLAFQEGAMAIVEATMLDQIVREEQNQQRFVEFKTRFYPERWWRYEAALSWAVEK